MSCIFCKIIDHEIPSSVIYEDESVIAFLDVSQVTRGHTLVVPKKHVANILECDPDTLSHLIQVTQMLAKRIMERTNAKGINILNNTHEAAGQTVMHLHFHIIPRYDENDAIQIEFHESEKQNLEELCSLLK